MQERLERVRARAVMAPPATSAPIIALRDISPALERCVDAGASGTCGTWADKPQGRRSSRRVPVRGEIGMRRLGSFNFQVPLDNVSTGGCNVELVEFVDRGDRVIARFPGVEPLAASVTWVEGQRAGIHFERPLHPAVFEHLLARLG